MKKIVVTSFIFCLFSLAATASPLLSQSCTPGGEYGNDFQLKLSSEYTYVDLVVLRKKSGTNYKRDLSLFKGGNYRLDLASHGGIYGFVIQYIDPETGETKSLQKDISCADLNENSASIKQKTLQDSTVSSALKSDSTQKTDVILETKPQTKTVEKDSESFEDFEEDFDD